HARRPPRSPSSTTWSPQRWGSGQNYPSALRKCIRRPMLAERPRTYLSSTSPKTKRSHQMPKFVIERNLPGAGSLSSDELHAIAKKSNEVLADMAPRAQWLQSYVTADKIYCVYVADNEAAVREHAECGGFPADVVSRVGAVI